MRKITRTVRHPSFQIANLQGNDYGYVEVMFQLDEPFMEPQALFSADISLWLTRKEATTFLENRAEGKSFTVTVEFEE